MAKPACVCIDIAGTLLTDVLGPPLPGALDAVAALREAGYALRFVTNTTSKPPGPLCEHLQELGVLTSPGELYTPFTTAERAMAARNAASGVLIATDAQRAELSWFEERATGGASVLVATEGHDLTLAALQPAFRALMQGATLYAVAKNRYFDQGGELVTDVGALVALLEYAANTEAHVLGKPSPLLFETVAEELDVPLSSLVMVGDDAEFDVSRCMELGLRGVLVRTGKYRPGDETSRRPRPSAVIDSLAELAECVTGIA